MADGGLAAAYPAATDPVAAARDAIVAAVAPVAGTETLDLDAALGRVLAEPLSARLDSPPADNSAMDGYALRAADWTGNGEGLPVSQRITAGSAPEPLAAGTVARIFTGGVVPTGADTVVMQEDCRQSGDRVHIERDVQADQNIRRRGEDLRTGVEVVPAGTVLRAQTLGLAASAGHGRVTVRRRPRIAILVTGNELVSAGTTPGPGKICNSNGPMLAGLVRDLGCELVALRPVADTAEATRTALAEAAREADAIISSGGVSVGEEDHICAQVEALGALELRKVPMKPGKPLAFGHVQGTPFLGLPGNPVSLFVTFALFGAPLLRAQQGRHTVFPDPIPVAAAFRRDRPNKRVEYLRVQRAGNRVQPFGHQGSGVLGSVEWADGLAVVSADQRIAEGDLVDYHGFAELLS